jgi:enterochelin esterase-like enzyme
MNKKIKAIVITPDNYSKGKEFPVVYLLHVFSGNYKDYITKTPQIEKWSTRKSDVKKMFPKTIHIFT